MNISMTMFWGAIAALCFLIEAVVPGLVSIWFVFGAIAALLVSLVTKSIALQTVIFFVVSGVLLFCMKPIASRYLLKKTVPTNSDALIGKEGIVTETIDILKGSGQVKIRGQIWSAVSESEQEIIPKGSTVTVNSITGVKLLVSEKKSAENTEKG